MEIACIIGLAVKAATGNVDEIEAKCIGKAIGVAIEEGVQWQVVGVYIPDKEFEEAGGWEAECVDSGEGEGGEGQAGEGLRDRQVAHVSLAD